MQTQEFDNYKCIIDDERRSVKRFVLIGGLSTTKDNTSSNSNSDCSFSCWSACGRLWEFLDSDASEDLEVDDTVPKEADFAVRVSGDSMEPRFANGQVVFIRKQNVLEVGDIGIFSHNGDAYIKKWGQGELISLNPRYLAIQISESDVLNIFGKVVG